MLELVLEVLTLDVVVEFTLLLLEALVEFEFVFVHPLKIKIENILCV